MEPVAGRPRARTVALAERAGDLDDRPAADRRSAERGRSDDHPDLSAAVVDHQAEPVGHARGRSDDGTRDRDPRSLIRLTEETGGPRQWAGELGGRPLEGDRSGVDPEAAQAVAVGQRAGRANGRPGRPRNRGARRGVEGDPGAPVLDERGVARFERTQVRGQGADDRRRGAIRQGAGSSDRERRQGWARARGRGRARGRRWGRGRARVGRGRRRPARIRARARRRRSRGRRRPARIRASARGRRSRGRRRGRGGEPLGRRGGLDEPVGGVVVRVEDVAVEPARTPLDARPCRRGGCHGSLDEHVRGVPPADRVDRGATDRAQDERSTRCRETAAIRRVGDRGVGAEAVRHEQVATGVERPGRRPGRFPGQRATARGGVHELEAGQVERRGRGVRDLDVLVGGRGAAGHDLGQQEPGRGGPVDRRGRLRAWNRESRR